MSGVRWGSRITVIIALMQSCGCASTQLNYDTVDISSTIGSVYTRQALNNLSKFIDDPYAIPSQIIMNGGVIQTTNTINPTVSFPLSAQIANAAAKTPTLLTLTSTNTTAGAGAGLSGTNSAQQNYTISPLSDANTLRNQQALYRRAVFGARLIGHYEVPLIFFQNKFYQDPYHLQKPHCVLCAVTQGEFKGKQRPPVYENEALPPKWLYWDSDPRLNELLARGEAVDLGHYGNHELFMSRADYYNGVLTDFVVFTLPNTQLTEAFGPVQHLTPGTPGAAGAAAVTSFPSMRVSPVERQSPALVIPQTIIPSQ